MDKNENNTSKEWNRKRSVTFFTFAVIYFNSGFEIFYTVVTSWSYVTELMNTDDKTIFYTLINTVPYIPPFFFASIVAHYGDKTRNIKMLLILINTLCLLGAVFYIIPNPSIVPVVAQFFSGFLFLQMSLINGEIARSYPEEMLRKRFAILVGCYGFGTAVGPCFAYTFINVNFYIFNIRIAYGNMSGVVRVFLLLITIALLALFSHNVSKEHDYKSTVEDITDVSKEDGSLALTVVKKADIMFLLFAAFMFNTVEGVLFVFLPVFVVDILRYPTYISNVCLLSPVVVYPLLTILIIFGPKHENMFQYGIMGIIIMLFMAGLLFLVNTMFPLWINVTLLISLYFMNQLYSYLMLVFTNVMLSKLVQSKYQSTVDSMRCQSRQLGALVGCLVGAYCATSKNLFSCSIFLLSFTMGVTMFFRRNTLKNPKIVL